jgi:hypothetical protein
MPVLDTDAVQEFLDIRDEWEWTALGVPDLRQPTTTTKMAEKKPKLLTPIGEAKWAFVHKPSPPFKDPKSGQSKGNPCYRIDVVFDPEDPKWKVWAARVKALVLALPVQADVNGSPLPKHFPFKPELDKEKNKTGRFVAMFKTSEEFKPGVFDKYNQPIPVETNIGNGSKVVVSYQENTYDAFGGGVNLYLAGVQVVDLVEYGEHPAESYGFQAAAPDESGGEATGRTVQETLQSGDGSDLPF